MAEITTDIVRRLIETQFPAWSGLEIRPVVKSGHDNRTFHLGSTMTVRLPSGKDYVPQVEKGVQWLPYLAKHLSLPISKPLAMGHPNDAYPFVGSVNSYIEGETTNE